jgi:haloalkane dehalogenase
MTDAVRTPDVLLEGLPGFPWAPRFRTWDGLRLAHVDEGDGAPVVLFHGEPTWGYLWRKVVPPLLAAGHRVVVPDLPGFGRSDKPMDEHWYTYERHTAALSTLVEELDLRDATFVLHDWGGPIGLRVAVELADRVERLVLMDTGVFTGEQPMSEEWHRFREFVDRVEELPISLLVRRACHTDPGDEVAAAYDAPFPSEASKAGARAFPAILPTTPDAPGAEAGRRTLAALREDARPVLLLWGENDPVLPVRAGEALASALGKPAPRVIAGAGHFLQEDQGEQVGDLIAEWLTQPS